MTDAKDSMSLCLLGDEILLEGVVVGRLLPGVRLSQRDRMQELFDQVCGDAETITELEARIALLEAKLKAPAR